MCKKSILFVGLFVFFLFSSVTYGQQMSNICQFTQGPRRGETQNCPQCFQVPVGTVCSDGSGSSGTTISKTETMGDGNLTEVYKEAFNFGYSSSMLNYSTEVAKVFAQEYVSKCGTSKRLNSTFYQIVYNFAYSSSMLDLSAEASKSFVRDFALSCHSQSGLNQQSYTQFYNFAYSSSMLDLSSEDAKKFVFQYVFSCARDNYLTPANYRSVFQFAYSRAGLNLSAVEAKQYTYKFFLECKQIPDNK